MQGMEQRRRDEEEEGRRQAARGGPVRRRRRRRRRVPGGDEDREAQLRHPEPERPGAARADRRRVPVFLEEPTDRQCFRDEQGTTACCLLLLLSFVLLFVLVADTGHALTERVHVSTRDDAPAPGLVRAQARGERSLRPGRQVVARSVSNTCQS